MKTCGAPGVWVDGSCRRTEHPARTQGNSGTPQGGAPVRSAAPRQAGDAREVAAKRIPAAPSDLFHETFLRPIPGGDGSPELRSAARSQFDTPLPAIVAGAASDPSASLERPQRAGQGRAVENEKPPECALCE